MNRSLFLLVDLKFKEICIRVWKRNLNRPLENEILVIKRCTSCNCHHVVSKSSHAGTNCSLIVCKILKLRNVPPFDPRGTDTAAGPWNTLTSPVWGAVPLEPPPKQRSGYYPQYTAGCAVPRTCISCVSSPHTQVTSSPAVPPDGNLVPYNTSLPCSLHTDGHSLVQMACPQPPPQHLKALKSLFKLLPPTGTFQATPHSPPEATGDPDLFRRDLFPTWERWDKIVPAVTPLSTLTCSWVLF